MMWDLLSGGKSRVSVVWFGLCPLPPTRAGPEVSQPSGPDPKGDLSRQGKGFGP